MSRDPGLFLLALIAFGQGFVSCSGGSFMPDREANEILFQKQTSGGIINRIGGELNAPSFTLTAGGRIITFGYLDGRRTLIWTQLDRKRFFELYERICSGRGTLTNDSIPRPQGEGILPVMHLIFENDTLSFRVPENPDPVTPAGRLDLFSRWVDSFRSEPGKPFRATRIRIYVRQVSAGDTAQSPAWPVSSVRLDTLVRKNVGLYEPNAEENSAWLGRPLSDRIQKIIPQSGIYQKFSFQGRIYAVGYRPLIP